MYDVVIIGAGPAGISAALCAALNGRKCLLIEKGDDIATTIRRYSVGKHVMAAPSYLPLRALLWFASCTREELLARWSEAVRHAQLNVAFQQEVLEISKEDDVFVVRTQQHTYRARQLIIAIGNQGTPRKLEVPGETLPHVHTQLDDLGSCQEEIVVVGGGDTALEAVLARTRTNHVTLVVRTATITKANAALTQRVLSLADTGQITIHFSTGVEWIDADQVSLRLPSGTLLQVPAYAVFVAIGTKPPRAFFQHCGVALGPDGTPELSVTYESSVPGLFIIGAAGGHGDLIKYAINQGFETIETLCGRTVEPADEEVLRQKIFFLTGTVDERISTLRRMIPLLAAACNEHLRELLPWSTFRQVRADKDIFAAGDHIDRFYFVLAGLVEITCTRDRSGTEYLTDRGPGGCFDEVSFFSGQPSAVSARVTRDALLWEVQRLPMLKFLQRTPNAHRILERTSLLRQFQNTFDLDETTLVHLVQVARVKRIEKGGTLFRSGDSQAVYFVRSGPVQISIEEKGLRPIILSRTPGQSVTETLFLRSGETITVTAIDNVEVVEVSRQDLLL